MTQITPQELQKLSSMVDQIKRLDIMLDKLAQNPEDKLDELGEKVISVLGRNVIDKRKDWIGEIVWVAIFNAIRAQREELRVGLDGRVEISECLHKIQEVQKPI